MITHLMELRKCIVCSETKSEASFNKEHVIPAAIGGAIKVWHICTSCNSKFGKEIDEPFADNNAILLYRKQLNIGRDRDIQNPFKGIFYDNKQNRTAVAFENGIPTARVTDTITYPVRENETDPVLQIKVDASRKDQVFEIAKKQLIKKGYDPSKFKMSEPEVDENIGGTVEVGFGANGDEIIIECMKIAFETICCLYPSFVGHSHAKALLSDLMSKKPNVNDDFQKELRTFFYSKFAKIPKLNLIFHAINIQVIENVGLVCAVKLFDLIHVVIVSNTFKPLNTNQEVLIWNDSQERTMGSNISFKPTLINFQMDLGGINSPVKRLLQDNQHSALIKSENQVTLFQHRIDHPHMSLDQLCDILVQYHKQNIFSSRPASFDVRSRDLYVKTISGVFIPLTFIKTELERVLHPILQFL